MRTRSSYNTPVTHVENSSGSFDTFIRSTLDSTSMQDCTTIHKTTDFIEVQGGSRPQGPRNASLALPVSQTHGLWAPLWTISSPLAYAARNSRSPVNLARGGHWAGAGSVKQPDPANACQGLILVPVCHGASK